MATAAPSDLNIGDTFGVVFFSVSISSMIYGATCMQTFSYFRSKRSNNDRLLRYGVAIMMLVDTFNQVLMIHVGYYYLIIHFGDPTAPLKSLPWSGPTEVIFLALAVLIFNSFLTMRLWRLSGSASLSVLAAALTITSAGTNIAYAIRLYGNGSLTYGILHIEPHGIAALCLAIVTECMLSASVAYHLHKARSGMRRHDDFLTKVIVLAITTGMLTTPFNVAELITYITGYRHLYALLFNFLLAKLYPFSFMTTLNIRQYLHNLAIEAHAPESCAMSQVVFETISSTVPSKPIASGPQFPPSVVVNSTSSLSVTHPDVLLQPKDSKTPSMLPPSLPPRRSQAA